jgi:hypothetical protein
MIYYEQRFTTIHIIGLDKPERIEGQYWSGGVVDEIGNVKPKQLGQQNITPCARYDEPRAVQTIDLGAG